MADPTPVPFEGVFVLFYFLGNGYSSVRIVHLTGEHFGIINWHKLKCGVTTILGELSGFKALRYDASIGVLCP